MQSVKKNNEKEYLATQSNAYELSEKSRDKTIYSVWLQLYKKYGGI